MEERSNVHSNVKYGNKMQNDMVGTAKTKRQNKKNGNNW